MKEDGKGVSIEENYKGGVIVTIQTEDVNMVNLLNAYIELKFRLLVKLNYVKSFINKGEVIIAFPKRGITVPELITVFKKLSPTIAAYL